MRCRYFSLANAKKLNTEGVVELSHPTKTELVVSDEWIDQFARPIPHYARTVNRAMERYSLVR